LDGEEAQDVQIEEWLMWKTGQENNGYLEIDSRESEETVKGGCATVINEASSIMPSIDSSSAVAETGIDHSSTILRATAIVTNNTVASGNPRKPRNRSTNRMSRSSCLIYRLQVKCNGGRISAVMSGAHKTAGRTPEKPIWRSRLKSPQRGLSKQRSQP
jgi:hypothetical protein